MPDAHIRRNRRGADARVRRAQLDALRKHGFVKWFERRHPAESLNTTVITLLTDGVD